MPAYCGLELAALKIARLALSTQMSIARRTSASLAWRRPRAASGRVRCRRSGGHAAGHLAGVVAAHAVGQHGQRLRRVGGHRVLVVAARPARVDGSMDTRSSWARGVGVAGTGSAGRWSNDCASVRPHQPGAGSAATSALRNARRPAPRARAGTGVTVAAGRAVRMPLAASSRVHQAASGAGTPGCSVRRSGAGSPATRRSSSPSVSPSWGRRPASSWNSVTPRAYTSLAGVARAAGQLLGRHVDGGAEHHFGPRPGAVRHDGARQAEVGELDDFGGQVDEHVGRLDVAVHDAQRMGVGQRPRDTRPSCATTSAAGSRRPGGHSAPANSPVTSSIASHSSPCRLARWRHGSRRCPDGAGAWRCRPPAGSERNSWRARRRRPPPTIVERHPAAIAPVSRQVDGTAAPRPMTRPST